MMKSAFVPPIQTKTTGGFDATIFEFDSDDLRDGLSGIISTPGMGDIVKSWSDCGICSDADHSCNLDPRRPEVAAAIKRLQDARCP